MKDAHAIVHCPNGVDVIFKMVCGFGLDNEQDAVIKKQVAKVFQRAQWVAKVMDAVANRDQVIAFIIWQLIGRSTLEADLFG